MRSLAPWTLFGVVGAVAWGCAVYDTDLLEASDGLSGMGAVSAEGGAGNSSSGGSGAGGTHSSMAGTNSIEAGQTNGGAMPAGEGGAGAGGEESEGGEPAVGGMGGSAGSAGSAGSGGSGGSGGSAGSAGMGGSAGSGGGTSTVKCSDHPLTAKASWTATASESSLGNGMESDGLYNPPAHLIDGTLNERWSSGKTQAGDEWIQIDFGQVVTLSQLTLQLGGNPNDWPRGYAVRVSTMSLDFNGPVLASGAGAAGTDTAVDLGTPVEGRYLLVRQTGVNNTTSAWWSIAEVNVGCVD